MRTRILGKTGQRVSVIGYGAMALSLPERPPETEAMDVLKAVIELDVTFIDTADTYCLGPRDLHHNEELLTRALRETGRDMAGVCVATKGGTVRTEKGWEIDGNPDHIYQNIIDSYEALGGREPISLWQHHWPDPRFSISESMKPVGKAVEEKLVRHVGVNNYSVAQIKEASDIVDIVSVQNQYNLWHREPETDGMLEYCENENVVFLPWRPMGGLGLSQRLPEIAPLVQLAREKKVSPQRVMIAWHLAKSKCILPIPGSRRLDHIVDCLEAEDLALSAAEVAQLESISSTDIPSRERPAAWEKSPPLAEIK